MSLVGQMEDLRVILTNIKLDAIVFTSFNISTGINMPDRAFVNRDGTASLRELAQKMCMLVNTFEAIMRSNYGTNPTFLLVLEGAKAACTLVPLLDELQAEFEPPSGDVFPPGERPGWNPEAPLPPAPPEI